MSVAFMRMTMLFSYILMRMSVNVLCLMLRMVVMMIMMVPFTIVSVLLVLVLIACPDRVPLPSETMQRSPRKATEARRYDKSREKPSTKRSTRLHCVTV